MHSDTSNIALKSGSEGICCFVCSIFALQSIGNLLKNHIFVEYFYVSLKYEIWALEQQYPLKKPISSHCSQHCLSHYWIAGHWGTVKCYLSLFHVVIWDNILILPLSSLILHCTQLQLILFREHHGVQRCQESSLYPVVKVTVTHALCSSKERAPYYYYLDVSMCQVIIWFLNYQDNCQPYILISAPGTVNCRSSSKSGRKRWLRFMTIAIFFNS